MESRTERSIELRITAAQGFPADLLKISRHKAKNITVEDLVRARRDVFSFHDVPGALTYPCNPTEVFLVESAGRGCRCWGRAVFLEQTVRSQSGEYTTSGTVRITQIFPPKDQRGMCGVLRKFAHKPAGAGEGL